MGDDDDDNGLVSLLNSLFVGEIQRQHLHQPPPQKKAIPCHFRVGLQNELIAPGGIDIDSMGRILITEAGRNRILQGRPQRLNSFFVIIFVLIVR